MALGLTQPLTQMSTRNISWEVEAASAQGWQPDHLHVPNVLKSGSLNLLVPSGPVQACNGIAVPFTYVVSKAKALYQVLRFKAEAVVCEKLARCKQTASHHNLKIFQRHDIHTLKFLVFVIIHKCMIQILFDRHGLIVLHFKLKDNSVKRNVFDNYL